jgi:hypothetical protein
LLCLRLTFSSLYQPHASIKTLALPPVRPRARQASRGKYFCVMVADRNIQTGFYSYLVGDNDIISNIDAVCMAARSEFLQHS